MNSHKIDQLFIYKSYPTPYRLAGGLKVAGTDG